MEFDQHQLVSDNVVPAFTAVESNFQEGTSDDAVEFLDQYMEEPKYC